MAERSTWKWMAGLAACSGLALCAGVYVGYSRGIPFTKQARQWSVAIYSGPSPFELTDAPGAFNPVLSAADVTDVKADFVADPFLVHEGDNWYLFVEVLNSANKQGDIGVATSRDALNWKYERIALDEPFHLSYPHVFKWDEQYYMIPESYEAGWTRLYRAEAFPFKWSRAADLIRDDIVDPSIVRHDERWWLFASANARGNDKLALWSADELTGPWALHPASPLIIGDGHIARPGGRVIDVDGRLYRIAQDDRPDYGLKIHAFEITKLTATEYEERPHPENPILKGSGRGWNAAGMHQLDAQRLPDGRWIAAVDGHRFVNVFGWNY
jgi:hypothetical protein